MTMMMPRISRPSQRVPVMQSYVATHQTSNSDIGLLERLVRNASIAGLAGVAFSGAVTLLPIVPATSATQWVCALAGSAVGVVLAFTGRAGRIAS